MWLTQCYVPDTKEKQDSVFQTENTQLQKWDLQWCFPFVLKAITRVLFPECPRNNQDVSIFVAAECPTATQIGFRDSVYKK